MKKIIYFILLLFYTSNSYAQQDFGFGYLFKKKYIENNGTFLILKNIKYKDIDTLGSFEKDGVNYFIKKPITGTKITPEEIAIRTKLKGIVKERNGDTLFIKFWNITNGIGIGERTEKGIKLIDSSYNKNNFAYKITKWNGKKLHFDLPYNFTQFMATNIPFRILTKTGNLESDFLNANASLVWVKGKTRIFKSELIKARNRYTAVGPFLGLSAIDNPIKDKKEFGINYGLNAMVGIQGLNFVIAYGFQNGFKTGTKEVQPYIGLGVGFKMFELFSPEIKDKEK